MAITKGFLKISGVCSTKIHEPGSGLSSFQMSRGPVSVSGLADSAALYCIPHVAKHCPDPDLTCKRVLCGPPGRPGWSTSLAGTELQVDLMSLPFSNIEP